MTFANTRQNKKTVRPQPKKAAKPVRPYSKPGTSVYDSAIAKMRTMKEGDSFKLFPPEGRTASWLNNTFTVACFRARKSKKPLVPPQGLRHIRRVSDDDKYLTVSCVKETRPHLLGKPKAKVAKKARAAKAPKPKAKKPTKKASKKAKR